MFITVSVETGILLWPFNETCLQILILESCVLHFSSFVLPLQFTDCHKLKLFYGVAYKLKGTTIMINLQYNGKMLKTLILRKKSTLTPFNVLVPCNGTSWLVEDSSEFRMYCIMFCEQICDYLLVIIILIIHLIRYSYYIPIRSDVWSDLYNVMSLWYHGSIVRSEWRLL